MELCSLNFPKRAQFHIRSIEQEKVGDWADHLRGATLMLSEKHTLSVGMSAVIEGELPIGGLSSSAAVIIAFLVELCRVNHIQLAPMELILMAKAAENKYVGVNCGKLDQSCEVLCREKHYYSEFQRVEEGTTAWEDGDIGRYGELVFQSGWSSIHNYE